ncbi:MAG: ABC transporter substrate-binding protein [Actinobacteria bacterium]|nr:ABC transporter substrate-binding protein [Actinomycetota bacterium]
MTEPINEAQGSAAEQAGAAAQGSAAEQGNTAAQGSAPEYRKRKRSTGKIVAVVGVLVVVAVVAVLAFVLTRGNGNGNGQHPTPGEGAGSRQLTVGLQLEPTNLDIRKTAGVALDQILIDNVYQGLIGLKPGSVSEFVPVLAEALPKVSADGLTYTFALRQGVTFGTSGTTLAAKDVVDSLSATLTEALLGAPAKVSAPDERTIEIVLAKPNSQLLWQLANRPGLVFETAYTGNLENTVNGTGPYLLKQWKQGDSITFAKNPKYWGEPAALDSVVWRYIPDGNAAVNAAKEGDVDVLAPVVSSFVSQLEGDKNFVLGHADSTDVFTLVYNSAKAPLDDVRVRTALSKAIDSQAIIKSFYGDGKALGGPITDLEPAYEDLTSVNGYDPEGAKKLLAEAGVKNLKLTVTMPNFYSTDAINQVVTDFKAVGVTLKVNQVAFATWLSDVYSPPAGGGARDFDLSYIDHAEAHDFVNYVTEGYYFGSVDPKAKDLYDRSLVATDPAEAVDLVKQAARIVADDAPAKWLINYTPTNAIGTKVHGFPTSNTNSRISLQGVTVD